MKETYKNRYGYEYTFTLQDDGTVLWEGNFEYGRYSIEGEEVTMVDPVGGPYIARGMPGTMVHSKAGGVIDYFVLQEGSYVVHLKKNKIDPDNDK